MSDGTRDRVEGKLDELKGRGKSAVGDLTGDANTRAEGDADQAKGKLQQGLADLKDKVEDIADDITDRFKRDDKQ